MSSSATGLALALSIAAVAVAGYGLFQDEAAPSSDVDMRLAALEEQMTRIEDRLQSMPVSAPSLAGLGAVRAERTAAAAAAEGATPTLRTDAPAGEREGPDAVDPAKDPEKLAALVDEAVEKKAAQMRTMANKKPAMNVFASTLELTKEQSEAAGREIVRAQHDIQAILETPTEDGAVLLDDLVEVVARGMAEPAKHQQRWMQFFGRVMNEKIPGSDETYAARIESVKQRVRDNFKRNWSERQYANFQTWQMDPTEVQGIEGSPWTTLGKRMQERARQLGAKLPGDDR